MCMRVHHSLFEAKPAFYDFPFAYAEAFTSHPGIDTCQKRPIKEQKRPIKEQKRPTEASTRPGSLYSIIEYE